MWHRRLSPQRWSRLVVEAARGLWEDGEGTGRMLVLTLRPWLVGQPFRIDALDRALGEIASWPGVWRANGRDIVDWYRSRAAG
jgi:hypothetical protein